MDALSRHIDFLLRHYDCVIVPGIGAFVARQEPASLDRELGLFRPPVRAIGFNPALTHDDGLLVGSVARRQSIPYEQASAIVSEQVDGMRRQLRVSGALAIPRVGSLRMVEGSLLFDPVTSLLEPYPTLTLIPVLESARAEAQARQKRSTGPVVRHGEFNLTLRFNRLRIAASVAVLLCLGMLLSTPINVGNVDMASFTTPSIEVPEPTVPLLEQPRHMELCIAIPSAGSVEQAVEDSAPVMAAEAGTPVPPDRYFVIVASLPTRALAEKFISQSDYPGLGILEKDDKYRVYASSAPTSGMAQSLIEEKKLDALFPGAWVCRK